MRGAPDAWFVDFTNLTGLVTQALLDEGHRAIGLCNVALNLQRTLCARLSVEPERLRLDHVGLNHLSWVRAVYVDDVDRLPGLLDELDDDPVIEGFPVELIRSLRAIPSYYLRYYYLTSEVLEHQRTHRSRAEEVMEIEAGLLELYRDETLDRKPSSSPSAVAHTTPRRRPRSSRPCTLALATCRS